MSALHRYKISPICPYVSSNISTCYVFTTNLIDNIDREDTHGISSHQGPWGTKLVESAFSDPGEDPRHGVHPVLRVLLHHTGHAQAIGPEFSTLEF